MTWSLINCGYILPLGRPIPFIVVLQEMAMIVPDQVLSFETQEDFTYTEREVAYYALGVGAAGKDPTDPIELSYVYHPDGQKCIQVLPTFSVVFAQKLMNNLSAIPGLNFDMKLLLHGEQYLEIHRPLPVSGHVRTSIRVSGLQDKGKAAIAELELLSRDLDTGESLCVQRMLIFLRGAGGFSPVPSVPYSYTHRTFSNPKIAAQVSKRDPAMADKPPDFIVEDFIMANQALLYRLSGDLNPLHCDPKVAAEAGFEGPILHGLCTLGYATRAVLSRLCGGVSAKFEGVQCRFLHHVYLKETLLTEIWDDEASSRAYFQCKVKERGKVVLSGVMALQNTRPRL